MGAKQKESENAVRGVRFAQSRSRETLRRILDAADEVFSEKGYSGATIAEIIKRAGIGHGTFWLYFHNKEDLVQYMLKEMVEEFESFAWYGANNVEEISVVTLPEVENIIRGVLDIFARYSSIHPLVVQASLESDEFRKSLDELNEPFVHIMESKLKEHLEKGLCKDLDPTVTAHIILSMLEYTNLQWVKEDIPTDQDTLIHNLSVILYHTLNH
jgi:AcrR family transcriptional regulator